MNVPLDQAYEKTVPGYSACECHWQENFDIYATADQRIIKKSSHFSWKSKDTRQNRKVKEGSCQLKSRILSMSHQLNTELWTTVAQW